MLETCGADKPLSLSKPATGPFVEPRALNAIAVPRRVTKRKRGMKGVRISTGDRISSTMPAGRPSRSNRSSASGAEVFSAWMLMSAAPASANCSIWERSMESVTIR